MMNKVSVFPQIRKGTINKNIYGHFSEHLGRCIYEGIWVGEDSPIPNKEGIRTDVAEALKAIGIPVLRWPGGCFADEYHWKDGIGPKEKRKRMVNTHWGGVVENNHFGTNEFLRLCEMLDCEPYICGNVGSGTVQEMQEWVEYITFDGESPMSGLRKENGRDEPWKLKYFGVGNENWGCGGNMRPEYYADLYRRYQTYLRNFGGNKLYKIACGPNSADYKWTEVLMREAAGLMDGLSLHYYTVSGDRFEDKGAAAEFDEAEWFSTLKNTLVMEELVSRHSSIMDLYDPEKKVALIVDEWGTWHKVEPGTNPGFLYQQNTLRDALVAGINLNIFNNHCDRVQMSNIAQTVNVLQAMILTEGERMILTPTYHVYDLYKVHHGARLLFSKTECIDYKLDGEGLPSIHTSASQDSDGKINITVCNLNPNNSADVIFELNGFKPSSINSRILTGKAMNSHNTFGAPENIGLMDFDEFSAGEAGFESSIPSKSVVLFTLEQ